MTQLDSGAKDLIALARDGDGPTERQRSRLRAAVLAEIGTTALTASAGGAAVSAAVGAAGASALGAAVGAGGLTAGAGVAAGGSVAAFAVKMVAIGAVLTGIGTGGYVVVAHRGHSKAAPLAPIGDVATSSESMVPIGATRSGPAPVGTALGTETSPEPDPTVASAPVPQPEPAPPPRPVAAARPHASPLRAEPVSEPVPETLEEETQALRQAVSALRNGRADTVLPALDAQDARYAHGALGEERAAARIEVLCVLGRTGEANALAARFLAQHPRSLQAARVRASCGGAQGGP